MKWIFEQGKFLDLIVWRSFLYDYFRICCISNKNTNKFNNSLVNIIYVYIFSMLVAHYSYLSHHLNFAESYICFICFSSIKYKYCRGLEVVVQLCTPVCTISEISRACFARGHDAIRLVYVIDTRMHSRGCWWSCSYSLQSKIIGAIMCELQSSQIHWGCMRWSEYACAKSDVTYSEWPESFSL